MDFLIEIEICNSSTSSIVLDLSPSKSRIINGKLLQVFDRIKKENNEDLFKKLIAVAGDVGEENLGLSSNDRLTLVEHINVIVHSAATLDFEADLKSTVNINLLGTRRVVQISQEIRDLKVSEILFSQCYFQQIFLF